MYTLPSGKSWYWLTRLIYCSALFIAFVLPSSDCKADDATTRDFLVSLSKTREKLKRLHYSYQLTNPPRTDGKEVSKSHGEVWLFEDNLLFDIYETVGDKNAPYTVRTIIGANPYYSFGIKSNQSGELVLTHIGDRTSTFETTVTQYTTAQYFCPLFLCELPARALHKIDPQGQIPFSLIAKHDGDQLSSFVWDLSVSGVVSEPLKVRQGAEVEHGDEWRIQSYHSKNDYVSVQGSIEYKKPNSLVPLRHQFQIIKHDKIKGDSNYPYVCDYNEWEYLTESPVEATFRVLQFNFPEPLGTPPPAKRPVPVFYWILTSAAGLLVLSLLLRWILKRRQRVAAAQSLPRPC